MKKESKKPARRYPRFPAAGLHFPGLNGQPAHVSTDDAARITGASTRTVNRWRRQKRLPAAPLRLLQLHHAGYIVPDAWRQRGAAFRPDNRLVIGAYDFNAGELDGYGVMLQALRELQVLRARELAEQRAKLAAGPSLIILPGGRF